MPFRVFIEQGSDYAELIRRAEEWKADLVVVGTHGRSGLSRWFSSSVSEHVVRHASCAVLVARQCPAGVVLVATDLSDPAHPAVETGAREAKRRGCGLVVIHVTESLSQRTAPAMALLGAIPVVETPDMAHERAALAKQIIEGALARFGAEGDIRIVEGDPSTQILEHVKALPAELLVLGTRGRSNVARVMLGSVAAHMVHGAPCSALAVRPAVV